MSIIFNSADIAETINNGVANVSGADSTITENYTNVVQHGIKIDMSVSEHTISGTPPLSFNSNGAPLIDYTIYGNTIQDGTPTPTSPIGVNGVGTISSGNYVIPIRTNTITNINLNSVPTTRRIKKLVLTGQEAWANNSNNACCVMPLSDSGFFTGDNPLILCNYVPTARRQGDLYERTVDYGITFGANVADKICMRNKDHELASDFKAWLAQQYANNTPVTIWYVLSESETTTVNEPLMKIGLYADSVSYSQAGVTIPTVSGNNTLDVQTTPKPSNISITYKGR